MTTVLIQTPILTEHLRASRLWLHFLRTGHLGCMAFGLLQQHESVEMLGLPGSPLNSLRLHVPTSMYLRR